MKTALIIMSLVIACVSHSQEDSLQANLIFEKYDDKKAMITTGYRLFDGIANYKCD